MSESKSPVAVLLLLAQTAKSVLRILRRSSFRHRLAFRPSGLGDCVVLGNGPSLRDDYEVNPGFFKTKACFCVNSFALSDLFLKIRPSHYVLLDPAYWETHSSPNLLALREQVFQSIRDQLDWPMTLVIPQQARASLHGHPLATHPNLTIAFFNSTPLNGIKSLVHPCIRANLGIPWAGTVVVGAVFAALNFGFRKVYLFGADHSWHENLFITKENVVCLKDKHFYDSPDPKPLPFYEDPAETHVFTMTELFQRLSDIFNGYVELERYAVYLGSKIYNAGARSYVDAFTRFSLKDAEPPGNPD